MNNKKRFLFIFFFIIFLLVLYFFKGRSRPALTLDNTCTELLDIYNKDQFENLKVYFNDALHQKSNHINQILSCYLDEAQKSIDAHFYQANDKLILDAFIRARERGVEIRFITDDHYYNDSRYYPKFYIPLMEAKIPLIHDQKFKHTNGQSHNKFAVIDGEKIWTGSYNITTNGASLNANNALFIHSRGIAENYTKEFNEMWGSHSPEPDFTASRFGSLKLKNTKNLHHLEGVGKVELCFDPTDGCKDKILEVMKTADYRIDFAVFSFTDDDMSELMIQKLREEGVRLQGVFHAPEIRYGEFSKLKELSPDTIILRKDLEPVPRLIHHKFFVIDAGTDSDPVVITGSRNFSASSDTKNDENIVVIWNGEIAERYLGEVMKYFE